MSACWQCPLRPLSVRDIPGDHQNSSLSELIKFQGINFDRDALFVFCDKGRFVLDNPLRFGSLEQPGFFGLHSPFHDNLRREFEQLLPRIPEKGGCRIVCFDDQVTFPFIPPRPVNNDRVPECC